MRRYHTVIVGVVLLLGYSTMALGKKSVSVEKFRIGNQIPGWSEESMSYQHFTPETIFDLINGGATEYIDNGMKKGIYQRLRNSDSATIELFAEDFGNSKNAKKMVTTKQSDGDADTSGFVTTAVMGGFWVCGSIERYYFEFTLIGCNDSNKAGAEIDKIIGYYRKISHND